MAEGNIFRPQSESEKDLSSGGFKDIRSWRESDVKRISLAKIADVSQEFIYKKREPFCNKCAITEIDEKIASINREIQKASKKGVSDLKIDFKIDYSKFGGLDNFERVDDSEIIENKMMDGMKVQAHTGIYRNYICKTCGSKHHIEFKNRELQKEETSNDGEKKQPETPDKTNKK